MDVKTTDLEEFLVAVLRGATKILGCGSTILILISEKTQEIRIRLGTMAGSAAMVAQLEHVLGNSFKGISVPLRSAQDSLAYHAWRDHSIRETSSLTELVGGAWPRPLIEQMARLIGEHRFIVVPALSSTRNYGVLLFQREGRHPFSRQQRELLLRYARRIGEILESGGMGQGHELVAHLPAREASLEKQLLQLTLGEAAPALFVDTDFRITSCNDAAEQIGGYGLSELLHQGVGKLFADPEAIVSILGQQILDPTNPYCEESAILLRKDGTICPARVEALLLADDRDQAVGFLVLLREGNEAERAAADRLVRQERLATMGEMAAQLAHEIRNPLVAIGATLETLAHDPAATAEQRAILASLTKEIVRLDMVLKDYLAAPHDLSFTEVDVARVVDDARRLLEGAHRLAGKRIKPEVPPGLTVRADPDALKHVLFNLLLNALEASPPRGEVGCSAATGPHDVSIFIEDRGPGLSASADECFRPFFTTKKNGTGLGLSVCQKIARAHGGLVDLRDRDGGGCRAVLVLPRRAGASEATT